MRHELLALASLLACSSARTPRSYGDSLRNTFKPNFGNADLEKLKADATGAVAGAITDKVDRARAELEIARAQKQQCRGNGYLERRTAQ